MLEQGGVEAGEGVVDVFEGERVVGVRVGGEKGGGGSGRAGEGLNLGGEEGVFEGGDGRHIGVILVDIVVEVVVVVSILVIVYWWWELCWSDSDTRGERYHV